MTPRSIAQQQPQPQQQEEQRKPAWAQKIERDYQAGTSHSFFLYGNAQDFVGGGQMLREYLVGSFETRDIIVSWNRATGLKFPSKSQAENFAKLTGFPLMDKPQAGGIAGGLNATASSTGLDVVKILERCRDPKDALNYLNNLLQASTMPRSNEEMHCAIVIDYTESIAPAGLAGVGEDDRAALVLLSEWGRSQQIAENGHIIFLIANDINSVAEPLKKRGMRWSQIEIPMPTRQERAAFLQDVLEADQSGIEEASRIHVQLAPDTSYEELARLSNGLRLIDLEDIIYQCNRSHEHLSREILKQSKREITSIESDEVLEVIEPEHGFERIGGLEEVKAYFRESIIAPMRDGLYRLVPQGCMLMGPAGGGKTVLVQALAKEAGFTFVALRPDKIGDKWQGETEKRLERAIKAIQSMSPTLVFMDEIDQAYRRGEGGDNGVSSRVFKRLLEVMSDTSWRGKVLWIGATNRPDLLDAALLRPGRFDVKIPILSTEPEQREIILDVLSRQAFGEENTLPTSDEYKSLAGLMTEEYTGAEIEVVVGKAIHIQRRHPGMSVIDALHQAYDVILPSTQHIDTFTKLALFHCNDLELIPAKYRETARSLRHPGAHAELLEEAQQEEGAADTSRRRHAGRRAF